MFQKVVDQTLRKVEHKGKISMEVPPANRIASKKEIVGGMKATRKLDSLGKKAFFCLKSFFSSSRYKLQEIIAYLMVHIEHTPRYSCVIWTDQIVRPDLPEQVSHLSSTRVCTQQIRDKEIVGHHIGG